MSAIMPSSKISTIDSKVSLSLITIMSLMSFLVVGNILLGKVQSQHG